jgi:hypothetical protein
VHGDLLGDEDRSGPGLRRGADDARGGAPARAGGNGRRGTFVSVTKARAARPYKAWVAAGAVAFLLAAVGVATPGLGGGSPTPSIGQVRRLSEEQYRQTIADIFGADIKIVGRFEPDIRRSGLMAVGSTAVTVTPSGAEQYDMMARTIAAQVVDEKHRDYLFPCKPKTAGAPDARCAQQVLAVSGRLLYRRPLTPDELRVEVSVANGVAKSTKSFYAGVQASLSGMLVSPEFLFVVERGRPTAGQPDSLTLDSYSRAARLALLLWNAAPDDELLTAAANGELDKPEGLARQVDRMMASARFERGVRAFFSDMFGFDAFQTLSKDTTIYPKFTQAVAADAEEQTLLLLVDHLVRRNQDYRELFTARRTFVNRRIGPIYRVPVVSRSGWEAHEFPEGDPRAGLLAQLSFLALHSHPGRSSPTLRGKAIRETLLCQEVPAPPPNVNFALVQDTANPLYRTARQRLDRHRSEPACAGCHRLIDPMGLSLENFDSSGEYRDTENGAPIDARGQYNGATFDGAAGLGEALRKDPQVTSCLVHRLYSYGVGRALTPADQTSLAPVLRQFNVDGAYRTLVRSIATSDSFYRAPLAPNPATPTKVALQSTASQRR